MQFPILSLSSSSLTRSTSNNIGNNGDKNNGNDSDRANRGNGNNNDGNNNNNNRNNTLSTKVLMQLPSVEMRLKRLVDKYANNRYGLIPVVFTGSLQDLRDIVNGNNEVDGRSSSMMMTNYFDTFTDDEYNEWCKMCQEYWLVMLQAVQEMREFRLPSYTTTLTRDSYLSLDRLLGLFERDTTGVMERDNFLASRMFQRMTFENQYLAKRIIERMIE